MIIVSTTNVHRDEIKELQDFLEFNSWKHTALSADEIIAIQSMINYCIAERVNETASGISYTELLNLKNKIQS